MMEEKGEHEKKETYGFEIGEECGNPWNLALIIFQYHTSWRRILPKHINQCSHCRTYHLFKT